MLFASESRTLTARENVMTQEASDYYRYCPDQPKIRISGAVCSSRRRVHYPHCTNCRFNDDVKTQPPADAASVPDKQPPPEKEH